MNSDPRYRNSYRGIAGQGNTTRQLPSAQSLTTLRPGIDDDLLFSLVLNQAAFGENPIVDGMVDGHFAVQEMLNNSVECPFPTPPDEEINGSINIGFSMETGAPVGFFPGEVHTTIAGGTGSGKTTLITHIIKQFMDKGIPVLVFDYENEFPERLDNSRINIFDHRSLRWNPLEVPEGLDAVLYAQELCANLSDTLGLLIGSKGFLLEELCRLYEIYGVFDGSKTFPSILDFLDLLEAKKKRLKSNTREYSYAEVGVNRFKALVRALRHILDCSRGWPLHVLTKGHTVILLNGIDYEYQTLLVTLMLTWLCRYRIANGMRNLPGNLVGVFLDESQRLYDRQQERRLYQGIPNISILRAYPKSPAA